MRLWRVLISAQTASFRYPNVMVNHQPSLKSIPYTTIQGLIASAYGSYDFKNLKFSYAFKYETAFWDIETIYKIKREESGKIGFEYKGKGNYLLQKNLFPNSDAFRREILFGCYLSLYLDNEEIAQSFKSPLHQLLLGRSGDFAKVESVDCIDAEESDGIMLQGCAMETKNINIAGEYVLAPKSFDYSSNTRQPIDIRPFCIQDAKGVFLETPQNKMDKFNMSNWQYKKTMPMVNEGGFFDKELQTHILLRMF